MTRRAGARVIGISIAIAITLGTPVATADPILAALDGMDIPEVAARWQRANDLEAGGNLPAANAEIAIVAQHLPDSPDPHWRIARNIYEHSRTLDREEKDVQIAMLERAVEAADRGLALDDECAECMLWKYAALGRIPTLKGLVSGAANARTLAGLLKRGVEVGEARDDPRSRATLAHFYYARATFHRMVPDWFWLRWVVGVRGNKEAAIADARRAVELDGTRSDFQIELGAGLLCLGHSNDVELHVAEAEALLQRVRNLPAELQSEPADPDLAAMLLETPEEACGFSRDGFLDVDGAARTKAP